MAKVANIFGCYKYVRLLEQKGLLEEQGMVLLGHSNIIYLLFLVRMLR